MAKQDAGKTLSEFAINYILYREFDASKNDDGKNGDFNIRRKSLEKFVGAISNVGGLENLRLSNVNHHNRGVRTEFTADYNYKMSEQEIEKCATYTKTVNKFALYPAPEVHKLRKYNEEKQLEFCDGVAELLKKSFGKKFIEGSSSSPHPRYEQLTFANKYEIVFNTLAVETKGAGAMGHNAVDRMKSLNMIVRDSHYLIIKLGDID